MRHPRLPILLCLTLAAAVLTPFSTASASIDLVVNGGFETGDFTGWNSTLGSVSPVPGGDYEAVIGGPGFGGIVQDIATTPGETYTLSFQLATINVSYSIWSQFRVTWDGQELFDSGATPMPLASLSFEVTGGVGKTTPLEFEVYKHTLYGDADFNGTVDLLDLSTVGENWHATGMDWSHGDFNHDGRVDLLDLSILGDNWRQNLSTKMLALSTNFDTFGLDNVMVSSAAKTPEPAALVVWSLLGMAAAGYGLLRRRRIR